MKKSFNMITLNTSSGIEAYIVWHEALIGMCLCSISCLVSGCIIGFVVAKFL